MARAPEPPRCMALRRAIAASTQLRRRSYQHEHSRDYMFNALAATLISINTARGRWAHHCTPPPPPTRSFQQHHWTWDRRGRMGSSHGSGNHHGCLWNCLGQKGGGDYPACAAPPPHHHRTHTLHPTTPTSHRHYPTPHLPATLPACHCPPPHATTPLLPTTP